MVISCHLSSNSIIFSSDAINVLVWVRTIQISIGLPRKEGVSADAAIAVPDDLFQGP